MKDRSHDEAVVELIQADLFYAVRLLAGGAAGEGTSEDELATLERQLLVTLGTRQDNSNSLFNCKWYLSWFLGIIFN